MLEIIKQTKDGCKTTVSTHDLLSLIMQAEKFALNNGTPLEKDQFIQEIAQSAREIRSLVSQK